MSTLGEHQGNGIRFDIHLSAPNGGVAQMLCRPEGQWVSWNEYEKLKAEVERLRLQVGTDAIDREHGMCCDSSAENARLKAEVENSNRINTELLLLSNQQAGEVRRLTAELSNISGWGRGLESDLSHARVEVSFLKAEVERLTERNKFLEQIDSYLQGANENAYEKRCDELEAEVERLRKAGDAMAEAFNLKYPVAGGLINAWNAAKEGKQS